MRLAFPSLLIVCVLATGCEQPAAGPAATPAPPAVSATDTPQPAPTPPPMDTPTVVPAGPQMGAPEPAAPAAAALPVPEGFTPIAIETGNVKLTPENTTFQVIGRHAPPRGGPEDPNFRTIVFEKFTGSLTFDPTAKILESAAAEIDATSLVSHDQRLTSHLKNPDFIDVEKFPTIKFESTRIEPGAEPGKVSIIGNLTLKDVTKEITIPATVTNDGRGATVHGQTRLNRREFNINSAGIDNSTMPEIDFTLAIGKKTERPGGRAR